MPICSVCSNDNPDLPFVCEHCGGMRGLTPAGVPALANILDKCDDALGKCDDILTKCNDIFEKLNE